MLRYFFIVLLLLSGPIQAYDFGGGTITIPDGFEGPISQTMTQGATSTAYTYPHDANTGTLLQITTWNPGRRFPKMTNEELKAGSEQYLLQFLAGIQRKRDLFKKGSVEFVEISGHPVAKVQWSGAAQGESVHGVMFCLIYNSKIYSFHTQDFSSFKGEYTKLAVNAFEAIKLNR